MTETPPNRVSEERLRDETLKLWAEVGNPDVRSMASELLTLRAASDKAALWLRLGKLSIAERPEGETYLLESEVLEAIAALQPQQPREVCETSDLLEVVYKWEDGREEVRYRATVGTEHADNLQSQVDRQKALHGSSCPYSTRIVSSTGKSPAPCEQVGAPQSPLAEREVQPFIVRHYASDERPCIKGNGFDGLEVGEDREEAEEFVTWINSRLSRDPSPRSAEREASLTEGDKVALLVCADECAHRWPTYAGILRRIAISVKP